jgi:acetoin utilization deacetylase AcuC-like enzyme
VFPCDSRLPILEPVTSLTAGAYCFDVGTPIMADTWSAALAAASGAYSAAQHTKTTGQNCYALARPPGHHASADRFGGYCYLNHAAIAARYLSQYGKVLVIDFDYHHGNGTQSIFYDSAKVFYLSFHADPVYEYPYFTGHEAEKGIDDGVGFNLNVPLSKGTTAKQYLDIFRKTTSSVVSELEPEYLVVSCGFDIAEGDPLGHFGLSPLDFRSLGDHIRGFAKPTTLIQEGGYHIEKLGENVESFLSAFNHP